MFLEPFASLLQMKSLSYTSHLIITINQYFKEAPLAAATALGFIGSLQTSHPWTRVYLILPPGSIRWDHFLTEGY